MTITHPNPRRVRSSSPSKDQPRTRSGPSWMPSSVKRSPVSLREPGLKRDIVWPTPSSVASLRDRNELTPRSLGCRHTRPYLETPRGVYCMICMMGCCTYLLRAWKEIIGCQSLSSDRVSTSYCQAVVSSFPASLLSIVALSRLLGLGWCGSQRKPYGVIGDGSRSATHATKDKDERSHRIQRRRWQRLHLRRGMECRTPSL